MKILAYLAAVLMALSSLSFAHDLDHHVSQAQGLSAVHAWTNETSARETFIFVELHNETNEVVELTGARSPLAGAIELVALANRDGRLIFEPIPRLPVPSNGSTSLSPDGVALRASGLVNELVQRSHLPIELLFGDVVIPVHVDVESRGAMQHSHAGHAH